MVYQMVQQRRLLRMSFKSRKPSVASAQLMLRSHVTWVTAEYVQWMYYVGVESFVLRSFWRISNGPMEI